jgi:hypothetical protein
MTQSEGVRYDIYMNIQFPLNYVQFGQSYYVQLVYM